MLPEHAREKAGMPPEWHWFNMRCMPPSNEPVIYFEITGAVAPMKTRGKDAGRAHNWRKLDKSTLRTVCITPKEHDDWKRAWEKKTGKCSECQGTGQIMAGWSKVYGTKYRPCTAAFHHADNRTLPGNESGPY